MAGSHSQEQRFEGNCSSMIKISPSPSSKSLTRLHLLETEATSLVDITDTTRLVEDCLILG